MKINKGWTLMKLLSLDMERQGKITNRDRATDFTLLDEAEKFQTKTGISYYSQEFLNYLETVELPKLDLTDAHFIKEKEIRREYRSKLKHAQEILVEKLSLKKLAKHAQSTFSKAMEII